MRVLLVGTGGHACVLLPHIPGIYDDEGPVIYDANTEIATFAGRPVTHDLDGAQIDVTHFVIAIGDNAARERLWNAMWANGPKPLDILAYPCRVPADLAGKGIQVLDHAVIRHGAKLGRGTIVNTGAIVEHDCRGGEFVHLAIGAKLCGGVTVGDRTLVGANAVVLPGITIGKDCTIGAGSVVTRDVMDGQTWIGSRVKP